MNSVFIAHAGREAHVARELAARLRAAGRHAFIDTDLRAGGGYDGPLRQAVLGCDVFVFLVSPSSCATGCYALTELRWASEVKGWFRPKILPVLIGQVPREDLPAVLQPLVLVSPQGNANAETLAAVARLVRVRGWLRRAVSVLWVTLLLPLAFLVFGVWTFSLALGPLGPPAVVFASGAWVMLALWALPCVRTFLHRGAWVALLAVLMGTYSPQAAAAECDQLAEQVEAARRKATENFDGVAVLSTILRREHQAKTDWERVCSVAQVAANATCDMPDGEGCFRKIEELWNLPEVLAAGNGVADFDVNDWKPLEGWKLESCEIERCVPPPSCGGRVTLEGKGLPGVHVKLQLASSAIAEIKTGPDGNFRFDRCPPNPRVQLDGLPVPWRCSTAVPLGGGPPIAVETYCEVHCSGGDIHWASCSDWEKSPKELLGGQRKADFTLTYKVPREGTLTFHMPHGSPHTPEEAMNWLVEGTGGQVKTNTNSTTHDEESVLVPACSSVSISYGPGSKEFMGVPVIRWVDADGPADPRCISN